MNPLFSLAYCAVFAAGCAAAMVWITERRDKTYRLGTRSFSDCFLSGTCWLLLIFGINLAVLRLAPGRALLCGAGMLALLAGYMAVKEISYRREASLKGKGRGHAA